MSSPGHLARFTRLSWSNRIVLAEALVAVAGASLAIRLLPFRRVVSAAAALHGRSTDDPEGQRQVAFQCRWAVEAWGSKVPWRAVCFQKGLALHAMLRRRGVPSLLHYGVAKDAQKGLAAHVWISLGEEIILGGEVAGDYACLATYPAPERVR